MIKRGDLLECIKNKSEFGWDIPGLTKGHIYTALEVTNYRGEGIMCIKIFNDNNHATQYFSNKFKVLRSNIKLSKYLNND